MTTIPQGRRNGTLAKENAPVTGVLDPQTLMRETADNNRPPTDSRRTLLLELFRTGLTAVGAGTIVLAWQKQQKDDRQQYDTYLQRKKDAALQFLWIWDQQTGPHRQIIEDNISALGGSIDHMSAQLATQIWASGNAVHFDGDHLHKMTDREKLLYDVKNSTMSLLNHLESISVAYAKDALDDEVVETSFKPVMIEWRHRLRPFTTIVDEAKSGRGQGTWQPFYDVVDNWIDSKVYKIHRIQKNPVGVRPSRQ
jgi:hypothetical protein